MKKISVLILSILLFACTNSATKTSIKAKEKTVKKQKKIEKEVIEILVPTIKIGNQEWMIEDIKTNVFNDGTPISEAKSDAEWKTFGDKKLACFRRANNGTIIYNGYAINDKRGLLPDGFVLPSHNQFKQLFTFLGAGDSQTGNATKALATYSVFIEDWVGSQEEGGLETVEIKSNGKSGFKANKGGFIYDFGSKQEGNCSYWWTSTKEGNKLVVVDIGYCSQDLGGGSASYNLNYGFAVRGIKK